MKIALAQISPVAGNVKDNIAIHLKAIAAAEELQATHIFFPELSITGYEPTLVKDLFFTENDSRLDPIQEFCIEKNITAGIGIPMKQENGLSITMQIFHPSGSTSLYSKKILHEDELPFFVPGNENANIKLDGPQMNFAICYESLQMSHAQNAYDDHASYYLASVAKAKGGISMANSHFPEIAKKFSMVVLMVNCVGYYDNFESTGSSGIWNTNGELIDSLPPNETGLLVFDIFSGTSLKYKL